MTKEDLTPYSPFTIRAIADSLLREFENQPAYPFPIGAKFKGAGIYGLYYKGDFPDYALISRKNAQSLIQPIYVGKAIPAGGRKGLTIDENQNTTALYRRLDDHFKSIDAATNLEVSDFLCRYLIVEDIFIELGERALIQAYKPVWNAHLDGFGNHTPGKERFKSHRSGWDELHPGRSWSSKHEQPSKFTIEEWSKSICEYLLQADEGTLQDVSVFDEDTEVSDDIDNN